MAIWAMPNVQMEGAFPTSLVGCIPATGTEKVPMFEPISEGKTDFLMYIFHVHIKFTVEK